LSCSPLLLTFSQYIKDFISLIAEVFIAIGTVSAVITALWLSYKDKKPELSIYAKIGIITADMQNHLLISCVNTSKQAISCTGFSFNPNRLKKSAKDSLRIMPISISLLRDKNMFAGLYIFKSLYF